MPASWENVLNAPVFVINMDACSDRMEISKERITTAGYSDVRRISAIDARTCDLKNEWAKFGSPAFDPQKNIETEFETYPGKQCCMLSWLTTLKHMIDNSIELATIFEDDVLFHKDWSTLAPVFYANTPPDYNFIYMGSQLDNPANTYEISRSPAFCTHAFIFTLEGAKRVYDALLNNPSGVYTIDWMLKDIAHKPVHCHPYIFYVWNAIKFHDPARVMPKEWTKRNCGLVFQDYDLGTYVREW